ncbi:hypothetical protein QOZ80_9AG0672940 [Eleusine coracana subsp. coracana]|nr:hypothetical protein QOZ80_9AG0672940 [Eleusine coracana subsp. coracana]
MDTWEAIKVVFERVRVLDPTNASKMVGMLLVKDNTENEMIRLALGPDHLIHAFVARARAELAATPSSCSSPPVLVGPVQAAHPWGRDGGAGEVDDDDCWSPMAATRRHLRRSLSLSDATTSSKVGPWKPCVYFARGFCKNGSSCRFLHDLQQMPRHDDSNTAPQQLIKEPNTAFPLLLPTTPNGGGLNFMLQQQQQGELQRSAAAAAVLLGGEQELMSRSVVHSPRIAMDRTDLMMMNSPAARQIYLTFPADSTFTEEDVSNYFSMYGPVQDVRIPYQQKRMFGFVTFVYPETVKIILSKGNPHFVCDARVLVKPYKEKGKVPDRVVRRLQSPLHDEYPRCMTPTGLLDPRDSFNLHQPIGPRMMLGDIAIQEAFLRRKLLEGQQQAAELEQAIELQKSRFMGLQLLDLKNRRHHLSSPISSPMSSGQTNNGKGGVNGNGNAVTIQGADNKLNGISSVAISAPMSSVVSTIVVEGKHGEQHKEEGGDDTLKQAVNVGDEEKNGEYGLVATTPNVACRFQESRKDHNLPESLLSSPTKAKASIDNISPHHVASSLFPPTSSLELSPYNFCFFQVPRFTSGHDHEAIGL